MDGIDLITEGVLTLRKAIEKLSNYETSFSAKEYSGDLEGLDGASILVKMLIEDCTHFNLWVGKAINPAHQNPNFPIDLGVKRRLVEQLVEYMKKLGKYVNVNLCIKANSGYNRCSLLVILMYLINVLRNVYEEVHEL